MADAAPNIDELSPEEQLELLERLWDRLSRQPERIPITDAQKQELERRLADLVSARSLCLPCRDDRTPGRQRSCLSCRVPRHETCPSPPVSLRTVLSARRRRDRGCRVFSRQTKPKDVALSQVTQNNEMLTGGGGCCCERGKRHPDKMDALLPGARVRAGMRLPSGNARVIRRRRRLRSKREAAQQ